MDSRINVTKSSMPTFNEYIDEIRSIWDTRWLTNMGEKHNQLESELKKYLDVDYISLMVNGHLALELGLQAMNIKGEVITTPFTFASTTHAIVRNGLIPVFCDINPYDYTIDVSKIERLITDKTCAIMPVHVYGNICNVDEINRIAKKYGLKVIYDAAHAFGEVYNGTGVMNFGDMSMLSFHATKVFHTIEGGAICYHESEYKNEIFKLRDFGIKDEETVDGIGANAKMNEFSAAMGLCNIRHVDKEIEKRKKAVFQYRELLSDLPGIKLNPVNQNVKSNYAYFPVVIDETKSGYTRNEICDYLKSKNIFARKYFYPLTNDFECFHNRFDVSQTPVALHISKRVVTLPLYADISEEEVNRVCQTFIDWKEKSIG
ncbi:dTDP-4-amino-4,6-dideoxygalactose transaminase [Lachnospiraceae bacterium]|nr:dTDP-4-amino-4,6-dideoxygalactose transaminase [Lachnospiraceae bacterium]